jgi:2'-5' RNA ligase
MARIRAFVGIDVGDDIRRAAGTLQRQLAASGAAVNWTVPANYHITLQFLGDVDDRELADVCRAVAAVTRGEPPFRMRVTGLGAFPTPRRPKVIWAGMSDGSQDVRRLFAALEEPLAELGVYRKEDRPYTPHLTLGRARDEAAGQALAPLLTQHQDWPGGYAEVEEVLVYSSELRRDGPEYSVIGRTKLAARRSAELLARDDGD